MMAIKEEMLEEIIQLRNILNNIKKMECTCSSFDIQYNQGCYCKKGIMGKETKKKISDITYKL